MPGQVDPAFRAFLRGLFGERFHGAPTKTVRRILAKVAADVEAAARHSLVSASVLARLTYTGRARKGRG